MGGPDRIEPTGDVGLTWESKLPRVLPAFEVPAPSSLLSRGLLWRPAMAAVVAAMAE